ncbi:MAG: 16S rRNA (uracil(1498)-N(3))-methyltransferase [Kiritimatiellae bacterium]|nr:16S rRNA (uracil(1498)-N(3))-methyltransferase [Kiritimatiellia bacterium]
MYRQQVSTEAIQQDLLVLEGEQAHHLLHVLRATEGTEVGAFDGAGLTRLYHVVARSATALTLEAKQPVFSAVGAPVETVLFACIPKGDRMEWLLEKATELGVSKIVPVMSARTVVRLDAKQAVAKQARWQRIVEAASRQCGAAFIPEVLVPQAFGATVELMKQCSTLIVAALIPEAQPLKPVLDTLNPQTPGQQWGWWCGPEGDFTKDEMQTILDCGAVPVTLGPLILRAETAAIYGLANLGCARNNTAFQA